jgi:holo-[acyl-carrier protein] synthase
MIFGIGTDIIEISRVAKSIQHLGQHFLDRLFTFKEQEYCLKYKASERHFAGRFAAKEAIAKALGTGLNEKVSWLDIEILNGDTGAPIVILSDKVMAHFPGITVKISISHNHESAIAFALIEQAH